MRRAVRHPDGAQALGQHPIQFRNRQVRIVQRDRCHADQAFVDAAEISHVAVVRAGCAIAQAVLQFRAGRERHAQAVGGEHQLFLEPQQVHGRGPVSAVEGPQALDFLGLCDQPVAHSDLGGTVFVAVPATLAHDDGDFFVGDDGGRIADLGDLVAQGRVGVFFQEVRQLHDVAVGIIDGPCGRRVGHGVLPETAATPLCPGFVVGH